MTPQFRSKGRPAPGHEESDRIDEASEESFPASDPPSWGQGHPGPPVHAPGRVSEPERKKEERRAPEP